jgi:hypothetical protein
MFTRGCHWWMCAHAGRRTEDQTWHAKRITAWNTTSQRRRKWRRKSANSRRDVVTNRERPPDNESEMVAGSINSVLQRATTTSVQEINKLITELQTLSDRLHSERARVQRERTNNGCQDQFAAEMSAASASRRSKARVTPQAVYGRCTASVVKMGFRLIRPYAATATMTLLLQVAEAGAAHRFRKCAALGLDRRWAVKRKHIPRASYEPPFLG